MNYDQSGAGRSVLKCHPVIYSGDDGAASLYKCRIFVYIYTYIYIYKKCVIGLSLICSRYHDLIRNVGVPITKELVDIHNN